MHIKAFLCSSPLRRRMEGGTAASKPLQVAGNPFTAPLMPVKVHEDRGVVVNSRGDQGTHRSEMGCVLGGASTCHFDWL